MKREHLYVTGKHPCVWLMALCMAASAATAIFTAQGTFSAGPGIWCGIVLPSVAAILFALNCICAGEETLYRTAVPVWVLGLCFAVESRNGAVWIGCLLFCLCYTLIIGGKGKKIWLLPLCLLGLAGSVGVNHIAHSLFLCGIVLLWPAIKVHNDGKWHPAWGDRIDGRQVRTAQVMEKITAYFMPNRTGASNLFSESVEITELERSLRCGHGL